jgi:hypothetical protein
VLDISWTAAAANGDPVASYDVTVDGPNGLTVSVPAGQLQYTFTGARTKTPYTVTVRGRNKAGLGDPGTVQASTFGLPGAPTSLQASVRRGEGAVDLSWRGADDNGSPITGYVVTVSDGRTIPVGPGEQTTVTGLAGGTTYSFTVQSVNAAGTSAGTSPPATAAPTTPPGQVGALTLKDAEIDSRGRPTKITATWSPPSSWNGGTNESYAYQFTVNGSPQGWASTTATSADFTAIPSLGLLNKSFTLQVEVRTQTSACELNGQPRCLDPVRQSRAYTRVTEPGQPQSLRFDPAADGAASVTARWDAPSDNGGSTALTYEYELNGSGTWVSVDGATTVTLPVDTSDGAVTVNLRVRAVSSYGEAGNATGTASITVRPT